MQKKLIALAVASMLTAPAFAQTNVKIYGSLDALFATFTNDGASTNLDDSTHKTSRLGFQGEEDLGGGLKAFFQLEERFFLDTATVDGKYRFKDKAWVGLKGGFGEVSFGRVPTVMDRVYGGGKIAQIDTIADVANRRAEADTRVDNGISYVSPKFGPVTLYAHTAVKEANKGKTPLGIAANATFGPAFVEAGWQKDGVADGTPNTSVQAVTNLLVSSTTNHVQNQYKTWSLNGGYKFTGFSLYAGYFQSKAYDQPYAATRLNKHVRYALGAEAKVGANGGLYATLSQGKREQFNGVDQNTYTKLGVAYQHNLSKRTQLITAASFERQDNAFAGEDQRIGLQAGLRHAF